MTSPVLHTYLVFRVGGVPLTPAEIGITLELGENIRRDGICEVIDALNPCWKCDGTTSLTHSLTHSLIHLLTYSLTYSLTHSGTLTATLASDILIPWLQLVIESVVNGNCDRAVTLAELGKIITAFTKLVAYNESLVISDGSR